MGFAIGSLTRARPFRSASPRKNLSGQSARGA